MGDHVVELAQPSIRYIPEVDAFKAEVVETEALGSVGCRGDLAGLVLQSAGRAGAGGILADVDVMPEYGSNG